MVGCAACGFFLIPVVGVNATLYLGGALNILVGVVAWQLPATVPALRPATAAAGPRRQPGGRRVAPASRPADPPAAVAIHSVFFLLGFVALGYEVLWTRYLALL